MFTPTCTSRIHTIPDMFQNLSLQALKLYRCWVLGVEDTEHTKEEKLARTAVLASSADTPTTPSPKPKASARNPKAGKGTKNKQAASAEVKDRCATSSSKPSTWLDAFADRFSSFADQFSCQDPLAVGTSALQGIAACKEWEKKLLNADGTLPLTQTDHDKQHITFVKCMIAELQTIQLPRSLDAGLAQVFAQGFGATREKLEQAKVKLDKSITDQEGDEVQGQAIKEVNDLLECSAKMTDNVEKMLSPVNISDCSLTRL